MKGYVYILRNESMPNLVKIGMSESHPNFRADELFTTGVPTPFTVFYYLETENPVEIETLLHLKYKDLRVNEGREFFKITPNEAKPSRVGTVYVPTR